MLGRRAGSPVAVYARVQCQEPKTGQQKVQLSWKTKQFAHLAVLLIYALSPEEAPSIQSPVLPLLQQLSSIKNPSMLHLAIQLENVPPPSLLIINIASLLTSPSSALSLFLLTSQRFL